MEYWKYLLNAQGKFIIIIIEKKTMKPYKYVDFHNGQTNVEDVEMLMLNPD